MSSFVLKIKRKSEEKIAQGMYSKDFKWSIVHENFFNNNWESKIPTYVRRDIIEGHMIMKGE